MALLDKYPEIFSDDDSSDEDMSMSDCGSRFRALDKNFTSAFADSDDSFEAEIDEKQSTKWMCNPIDLKLGDLNSEICIGSPVALTQEKRKAYMDMIYSKPHDWHKKGVENGQKKLFAVFNSAAASFHWGTKTSNEPNKDAVFNRSAPPVPSAAVKKNRWHALAPDDSPTKCTNICEELGIGIISSNAQSPIGRPSKKKISIPAEFAAIPSKNKITGDTAFVDSNIVVADGYIPDETNGKEAEYGEWITVSKKENDSKSNGFGSRGFGKQGFSERRFDNENSKGRGGFSKNGVSGFMPYGFSKTNGSHGGMGGFVKSSTAAAGGFSRPNSSPNGQSVKRNPVFSPKASPAAGGFAKTSPPRTGFGGGIGVNSGFGAGIGVNGQQRVSGLSVSATNAAVPKLGGGFGGGLGNNTTSPLPAGQGGFGKGFGGGFANPAAVSGPVSGTASGTAPVEPKWDNWDAKIPTVEEKSVSKEETTGWNECSTTAHAAGDAGFNQPASWDNWDA